MAAGTPRTAPPCEVMLDFADGEYLFKLPVKMIGELETATGLGIGALFARVLAGRVMLPTGVTVGLATHANYRGGDLREVVRCGLIGGGTKPAEALRLVGIYVDDYPLEDAWDLAVSILAARIEGYQEPSAAAATGEGPAVDEVPAPGPEMKEDTVG